jgi:transposase
MQPEVAGGAIGNHNGSIDFRRKVLAIKEQEKLSFEEAARRFGVGKASLVRWSARPTPTCSTPG